MAALLLLNFIFPFVMILVGVILKKNPVSDRASHNGYNTPTSRKSQQHWDYAQSIAPDIFISHGKILLIIEGVLSIVSLILRAVMVSYFIGLAVGCIGLLIAFFKTEKMIKDKFAE